MKMVGNKQKGEPLSDEDLVTKLGEAGYPVARRTVTKYRKMLNIASSRQRKVWGQEELHSRKPTARQAMLEPNPTTGVKPSAPAQTVSGSTLAYTPAPAETVS